MFSGNGFSFQDLFDEAVEKIVSGSEGSSVKAEGKFIEIIGEVLVTNRALMDT